MTTVALAGNPNCGKTTLFNRLTGLRQRVGNYPGVTVERRAGHMVIEGSAVQVVDLPGTYSLVARSRDEAVAFEVLSGARSERLDLVVAVVDASNLERNLYLVLSLLELGRPLLVALNMMDELRRAGHTIDVDALSERLGVPVVAISARSGEGVDALKHAIDAALRRPLPPPPRPDLNLDPARQEQIDRLAAACPRGRPEALWLLGSLATVDPGLASAHDDHPLGGRPELLSLEVQAQAFLRQDPALASHVIEARHRSAKHIAEGCLQRAERGTEAFTDRADGWLLHPVWGLLTFVGLMFVLFQSIFAWANPFMDFIESGVTGLQSGLRAFLPAGALADMVVDGAIGGVGNVVVFVPQIAFLFLFITVLEDSGYLARAAYISDRFMAKVGLHGRAFIPLLSGFACAVPAIMAARSIEHRRDRLVTILVTPLMTCSARLPVFTLILGALFAGMPAVLGIFSVSGLLLFGMYTLSVITAVLAAWLLKRTLLRGPTPPLVLELPPYRMPRVSDVLKTVWERCFIFLKDAGTIILALSIVMWALTYFPRAPDGGDRPVGQTIAGQIGHALEPAIEPLGYDWRIGIGLLGSFAAREVFVSTMALVHDVDEDAGLRQTLRSATWQGSDRPLYTPLVGLSLMVFFLFAAQCMSTVAVIRRETSSWNWALFTVLYMNVLAWVAAFALYQGGRLLGFS
ncbi:MAG: ferrous iron transport protein B [Myxococcota bacterium]